MSMRGSDLRAHAGLKSEQIVLVNLEIPDWRIGILTHIEHRVAADRAARGHADIVEFDNRGCGAVRVTVPVNPDHPEPAAVRGVADILAGWRQIIEEVTGGIG